MAKLIYLEDHLYFWNGEPFKTSYEWTPHYRVQLQALIRPIAHPDTAKIVTYMQNAPRFIASMHYFEDILQSTQPSIAPAGSRTDGVWAWQIETAYHVEVYNLKLPEEFIAHLREHVWRPPTQEELDAMTYEY